jgi:CubicO group peptidase (beta-lactamase class C family)
MSRGFTTEGAEALHTALARHVERGELPGLVALVARDGDVHVEAIGHKAFGDGGPIGRDAIFRIASLTKPIAGVAAMLLIEDGAMALDDPVGRWLPELAEPRVLRTLESDLDDTVPAERPIMVEDVLSFRLGFGSIMTPGTTRSSGPKASWISRHWCRRGRRPISRPASGSPGSAACRCSTSPARDGATTPARRWPACSSSGSRARPSPMCCASGCSSRSA